MKIIQIESTLHLHPLFHFSKAVYLTLEKRAPEDILVGSYLEAAMFRAKFSHFLNKSRRRRRRRVDPQLSSNG